MDVYSVYYCWYRFDVGSEPLWCQLILVTCMCVMHSRAVFSYMIIAVCL